MTALFFSVLVTAAMAGLIYRTAKRRPPGTPLTWGEAFVAGLFMFAFMLMIYAVVPNQWLQYADSNLAWRPDKIGIPLGGIAHVHIWFIKWSFMKPPYRLFPSGISYHGRFKVTITAEGVRDIIATMIYGIAVVGQVKGWLWWQRRGVKKPAVPELTSAYGRPLLKRV